MTALPNGPVPSFIVGMLTQGGCPIYQPQTKGTISIVLGGWTSNDLRYPAMLAGSLGNRIL